MAGLACKKVFKLTAHSCFPVFHKTVDKWTVDQMRSEKPWTQRRMDAIAAESGVAIIDIKSLPYCWQSLDSNHSLKARAITCRSTH